MDTKKISKNGYAKNIMFISVFVISIIVIGISVSYSFYSALIKGGSDITGSTAAKMDVTTTLNTTAAINAAKLSMIDAGEYLTKAEKVRFSVTNGTTSNVKAKYTVQLVDMSLSKNLASKYFKWTLIVNAGTSTEKSFTGNFADTTIAPEGTSDTTVVNNLSKTLITDENAITLDIGATDNIDFYIWLENDPVLDQLYLTNGNFTGKLNLNATPTK